MSAQVSAPRAISTVDPQTDRRWATLAASERGSLFTSPPWIRAICGTYDFAPSARVTVDERGDAVDGLAWVPISDIRGDRLVSMPFSDRAEPFIDDIAGWWDLAGDLLDGDVPFRVRCLSDAVPLGGIGLNRVAEAAWHTTPLGMPVPELHAALSSAARRNISAAQRNGVEVEVSQSIDGIRAFHRLHVALRKYKYGQLAQPLELFERIWEEFADAGGVFTLLARAGGAPVAGAVYLVWNDTIYYKFGASLANALRLRPNDLIAWTALCLASERGLNRLDWGLSDLDQPGLVAYKRKWASVEKRIVTLRSPVGPPGRPAEADGLLDELTRLLTDVAVPDRITERAGTVLYRYFS